ncbi:MAG: pentapeptide repeat-containing protein [Deltaproteobacteria bacterium]|nr:pentapeptide repeat-containing protein [Deltaproteobacteria bacterium]MBI4795822.1 pentapeptide repeat-containing protein [Deltaproteobacteria bacterium]
MSQDLDQQVRKAVADFCRQAPRRYPLVAGTLGILVIVLIIWFIPHWQVPVSGLSLKDRLHQINENRKTVAQIVGGVFILWGLYIAWVRSKAMRDQAEVEREQQLTDLYVKAIEQLGNGNIHIRLGGIYALERIARESPKDHWTIMEVLTAFVRENAPLREEAPVAKAKEEEPAATPEAAEKTAPPAPPEKPPTDIQAVLTVLGRTAVDYAQKGEKRSLDLTATHLAQADMHELNLNGVLLNNANLRLGYLLGANFCNARFGNANLQSADLEKANLRGADLRWASGLTAEQSAYALWDETTRWPDDFEPLPPLQAKEVEKD